MSWRRTLDRDRGSSLRDKMGIPIKQGHAAVWWTSQNPTRHCEGGAGVRRGEEGHLWLKCTSLRTVLAAPTNLDPARLHTRVTVEGVPLVEMLTSSEVEGKTVFRKVEEKNADKQHRWGFQALELLTCIHCTEEVEMNTIVFYGFLHGELRSLKLAIPANIIAKLVDITSSCSVCKTDLTYMYNSLVQGNQSMIWVIGLWVLYCICDVCDAQTGA
ncbi:hypothetical protein AAFF_G00174710 [Aldrovandia affinis]|uniref:Uncharacterized protein n=1 Tax=Aldrovandia affinis TaxID=143900 RepID=A0AAD7RLG6_9TELE|nr:hypothetical protein AAFF_G00174710 [Aldrovandia affinis]